MFISWSWQNEMINESTLWSLKMTGQQAYRHFTSSCECISACYWDVHWKTGNVDAEVTNWGTPYVPGFSSSNWKCLRGIKARTPLLFSFRCVSCPRRRQMPGVRLAFVASLYLPHSGHMWKWSRSSLVEHSNSGKKVSILATELIFIDSIRQSDKFAACTLIFK